MSSSKTLKRFVRLAALTGLLPVATAMPAFGEEPGGTGGPWAVTAWGGWGTDGVIENLPGKDSDFENSWFAGLSLSREFARTGEHFAWELEGIIVKHFGWQTHWEGDLAVGLRWDGFSWSENLRSSIAIGTGVSYASSLPPLELAIDNETKQWLQFLSLEIDFTRATRPDRALVLRLHHRSTFYGLYGAEDGGANFLTLGLRQRF